MLTLTLPYPPSVNHYWRRAGARTVLSREGREYRRRVGSLLAARRAAPLSGALRVLVELHPPDARRRDLDNCLKALLDALEHAGVYHDDGQIAELSIARRPPRPGGLAVTRVEPLPC